MVAHVAYWFDPAKGGTYFTLITPLLLGVEPFFVLGGFLAAISFHQIIIKNSGKVTRPDAVTYIKRRWLRTLPNYFLFLCLYYTAFSFAKTDFIFDIKYLFFAQNLFWLAPGFFSVSWSLATQEWFYVLLPLFLVLSSFVLPRRMPVSPLFFAALALIVTSFIARFIYLSENPVDNLEGSLRRIALLRLDSIAVGVLIGHIYFSYKDIFFERRLPLFITGLIGILALSFLRREPDFSALFIVQMIFYPIFSICLGLCMPWMYEIVKPTSKSSILLFENTSKWSYSLYLSHVFFLDSIYLLGQKFGIGFNGGWLVVALAAIWIMITYTTSALIYNYFEVPILKLGKVKKAGFFGILPGKARQIRE